MKVQFKNSPTEFESNSLVEQKLYRAGEAAGWMLSMTIEGNVSSEELDALLVDSNIGEITVTTQGVEETETAVLVGYDKVTSCVVKRTDAKCTAEIQLTKGV